MGEAGEHGGDEDQGEKKEIRAEISLNLGCDEKRPPAKVGERFSYIKSWDEVGVVG